MVYALVSSKEFQQAQTMLDQAQPYHKQTTPLITTQNWLLVATRNPAEARKGVAAGLALETTPVLLIQDALLKIQQKDYTRALARIRSEGRSREHHRAAGSRPDLPRSEATGRRLPESPRVRRGSSRLVQSQLFAADWLAKHGNVTEATAAVAAAKAADPKSVVPDLIQAQMEWGTAPDRDRSRLNAILAANQQNVGAHLLLAMIEDHAANHGQAIAHYRRVVELDPRQPVALNGLAYQLRNYTNNLDEALNFAQRAKDLEPANPSVDNTIGWIMYRKENFRPALEMLEKAAAKTPDPVVKYHLAMTYFKLGDVNRGRQALLTALKVDPKLPEAAEAMAAEVAASRSGFHFIVYAPLRSRYCKRVRIYSSAYRTHRSVSCLRLKISSKNMRPFSS